MCAMFTDDPAGKPVSVTVKVAVAAVIALFASLVRKSSMRTVPPAVDSALPTGGTSLAAVRVDVKTGLTAGVGVGVGVGCVFAQPATRAAEARAMRIRFMILPVSRQKVVRRICGSG